MAAPNTDLAAPAPPVTVEPGAGPVLDAGRPADAVAWTVENAPALRAAVAEHGSVRVRDLGLDRSEDVAAAFAGLTTDLMPETEAFAPRWTYSPGVYSSSHWPPNQPMCMHHELSYTDEFPSVMLFACLDAPDDGGATALADAAAVHDALPADLVRRFREHGWELRRSYSGDIGVSVAEAFGTEDRVAVERYCTGRGIEFAWQPDGGLRTRQRRSAVVGHPRDGRACWFNQIAFLNEWTMAPEVREYLVEVYGPEALPFTTAFGDGSPVTEDVVATINGVYTEHTVRAPWRAGDLLLVDNVATAHSREPYRGSREVLVGLGDPVHRSTCRPAAG